MIRNTTRFGTNPGVASLALPFAIAIAALPVGTSTAAAAEIQMTATNPVVELNVFEQVQVAPDIVTIGAGVSTDAPTAVEALRRNSAEMQRVIAMIKALGVDARDIQTTAINLNAQYDYDRQNERQVFRAYRASNQVSVKLRDIPRAGEVLDALVASGATDIVGPNFSIEDDEAAKAEARKRALETGRKQAGEYAAMAGYSGVRLLQVSESISRNRGPVAMERAMVSGDMAAPPPPSAPMEPGMVSTGVGISLSFEMVP